MRCLTLRGRPERLVQGVQLWARPTPLEHGDPLSEGEDLNRSVMPTAEEDADSGQESKDEFKHEHKVVTRRNVVLAG
jgi:hypothetical protein